MKKELQSRIWQCLPKEARLGIIQLYVEFQAESKNDYINRPFWVGIIRKIEDIFGHHHLTSDTEPSELLFVERKKVQELYKQNIEKSDKLNLPRDYCATYRVLTELFGDKCLPDKEPSVQGEPKYKIDDKVVVAHFNKVGIVRKIKSHPQIGFNYEVETAKDAYLIVHEVGLEPYTEPETSDPKLSTQDAKLSTLENNNMEEKELNLCELLKGCKGEEFYSHSYGRVMLEDIIVSEKRPIVVRPMGWATWRDAYYPNGNISEYGLTDLFPSRALYEKYPLDAYSAWMEWKSERTPKRWRAEKGEIYWWIDDELNVHECKEDNDRDNDANYEVGNYFKDEQTAKQAAEAVRECLAKFHEKISSQNLHNPK